MGTPSGPEAVRAVQKVLLVDGLQHLADVYRVSLRRQDGIWRVDDYWLRTER
ncbi:MAG TPA: hypothetical protein VIM14_09265 [Polyangia bacterium]